MWRLILSCVADPGSDAFLNPEMEFLNSIFSRGFWAQLESSQTRVFVWFSTLLFPFYRMLFMRSRGGRKVPLIDLPIPIRSSDFNGRYIRLMSSSDFCIAQLCRFVLSSDSLIVRSCFLFLSSDFCIVRLCRPVLIKKLLFWYFICW